jgi:hypothetical protein
VKRPAYYAATGSSRGDLSAILHPPYTAWHLSHAAIGAALAPSLDWQVLTGTLLAFLLGTGVAAHALDEWHGRPLGTSLSDRLLLGMGLAGMTGGLVLAAIGAAVVSPWVLAWAVAGVALAAGYALERPRWLHTALGFALAWGGFPVLVGYWAQTERVSFAAVLAAAAATVFSLTQRTLSTPARHVRRSIDRAELLLTRDGSVDSWNEQKVLATWERPLRLLVWAMVILAGALLATHLPFL